MSIASFEHLIWRFFWKWPKVRCPRFIRFGNRAHEFVHNFYIIMPQSAVKYSVDVNLF